MIINQNLYAKILGALGGCILCIILVAGLWPFHAPKNDVKWLENGNGLAFGRFGSVLSASMFHRGALPNDSGGSLEIWLKPAFLGSKRTILSFDGSDHPGAPFSLFQSKDGLMIYRHNIDDQGTVRTAWFVVNDVFREKKAVLLTITVGKQDTSVYRDGVLLRVAPIRGISINNFSGRLVFGNSPSFTDSWSGEILGLAIYPSQLSPSQVAQHYESWTKNLPALTQNESPVALYLFEEGRGNVVRNEMDLATSLTIPDRYFVLHQSFLSLPQHEYHPTWGYWEDVAVNIAGFIPLGAWAVVCFSSVRAVKWPFLLAILMGFSASVTIEVLQSFLPTRSSGMTDIITNTLGTVIGAMLGSWPIVQDWLARVRQRDDPADCGVRTHAKLETVFSD